MKKRHLTGIIAMGAISALALAGCASDTAEPGDGGSASDEKGTITLGFLPTWTDGLSMAYLAQDQLEKLGYKVDLEEMTDAGPLFTGVANGDFDVYPSAWPQVTHADYMKKYADDLEDLGAYYDGAVLTIAVPTYMKDINSIEDLKGQGDRFDGKITGIEPGAGLTKATQKMIPEYGLDGEYELQTSSTAGMLATLDTAYAAKEDVVVTLWRPFWAYNDWDMKDLEDPKGAMGEPETLNFIAHKGTTEEFPEAAELFSKIKLDDDQYGSLEGLVTSDEYKNKPADAVDKWIEENGDQFDWLVK
ncbi:glycine betaine ABC transporter substrate-binding protein [Microbacterium sp. ARD32]|uniref:glycine betaine ABC transporter substrate-binding protein n=1 Tax=Microbacterium sp. ARD32 TaxID=2962577 RepID=UPI002882489F|nr:glycine betaine ABC transporter substrate-binding protein [Microbacterium sp. ARD32]MDT0157682.1 glycine betaine ABC transporter substrate-binding protein [Microbacterium sp. ARD32]